VASVVVGYFLRGSPKSRVAAVDGFGQLRLFGEVLGALAGSEDLRFEAFVLTPDTHSLFEPFTFRH
jgi:hypothetical protein